MLRVFLFFLLLICFWGLCSFFSFITPMSEIRIASLNMNGARDRSKRAQLFELAKQKRFDVALLQETHSDAGNAADWAVEWDGLSLLSHNTSISGGVAILFSKSFTPVSYDVVEVLKGRLLKVRIRFENYVLVFICVYAPTKATERLSFLDTLSTVLFDCNSEEYLFVGGDFNCTERIIDRNHTEPHMLSRKNLIQVIKTHELSDVWRNFHGEQRQYTWAHAYDNTFSLARLDRFYSFKHHLNIFRNCLITPVSFSDHSLVQCVVTLRHLKPRSAYWHFNTNLTQDKYFKDVFKLFWDDFRTQKSSFKSLQQWWDVGKIQIQQLCKQYTHNITKDITRSIETLEEELLEAQDLAYNNGHDHIENLMAKRSALADLLGTKVNGALVRSRFQGVDQMDMPSKFFFNLEKKNGQRRLIHSLRSETGALLSDASGIRNRAVQFYKELYKSEVNGEGVTDNAFLDNLPQVSAGTLAGLDTAVTLEELESALQLLQGDRAPGLDGIPTEFYKVFWSEVGEDLLAVLNDSLAGGRLPVSCRRAVLTLLPKKGDLTEIKSWRPVSLLCSDYKILSKVLSKRLSKVMEQVVHADQTYCVPGRSIADNVSLIRDVIDVSRILKLDVGLISLDQEKAFDRVEHKYLWDVLGAFGFSETFISMLKVMYCDVESILKINGGLSAPFKVNRGVRQGCSLSGMLYSLAIEPLLNTLRIRLNGISIPGCINPLRLSAYADDVVLLINGERDITALLKILNDFGLVSSAKVNWSKSEALLLGQWLANGVPNLPGGLLWKKDGFKYLGIFLGNDTVVQKNWEGALEKVKGRLEKWKWLLPRMSYRGRTLIINNLVASCFWHRLACVDPPPDLLCKIQSLLVNFFGDHLHWVPQAVLFLPKDEGGHGLMQMQSRTAAFRMQFIKRLLSGPSDVAWRAVSCSILKTCGGLGLDKSLFLMTPHLMDTSGLPPFYRSLFKIWDLFIVQRNGPVTSLHWLLQEPLVFGARLDITAYGFHALTRILLNSKTVTLRNVFDLAGPNFVDIKKVADHLGVRSVRATAQFLDKWRAVLTVDDFKMLGEYCVEAAIPNEQDRFPDLILSPKLDGSIGPFLEPEMTLVLSSVSGKQLYQACVKVFNKRVLNGKVDTPWRTVLRLGQDIRPEWRSLYKPPLDKRVGDLQWRILHGAIAVNAFISVLNQEVDQECPFCPQRETIFHAFVQCIRLKPLFVVLEHLFNCFNKVFTMETFIFGFRYVQRRQNECKLLNFILGQAKMAIYLSRKNKVNNQSGDDALILFSALIKYRILIDFRFYKLMQDLESFESIWCIHRALCTVVDNELIFVHFV